MRKTLLETLKKLSMLKYIQLLENSSIYLEKEKKTEILPRGTILSVHHKNLGKRYYVNEIETLHVSFMSIQFKISSDYKYRWLTPNESVLFKQPVTIVEKMNLIPIEEQLRNSSVKLLPKTKTVKVGTIIYIDGFAYDSFDKQYVPYTEYKGVKFEVHWDKFILTLAFESLFKQSRDSCLSLNKQNLLK